MSEARILIVDNQREVARVLRTSLELLEQDFLITDVPSGEEALLEIGRVAFDLVIAEHYLPGMTGVELIRRIQKRTPETRAIVTASHNLDQVEEEIADLDVITILEKPIETGDFTAAVKWALFGEEEIGAPTVAESSKLGPIPTFDDAPVSRSLSSLMLDLGAEAMAFISRAGEVLIKAGSFSESLRFSELAVLLARNFTTTAEVSTYLGDKPSMAVHYYQGGSQDIYAMSVGIHFFLAMVFPGSSQKQMGPVLRYGRPAVRDMIRVIGDAALTVVAPAAARPAPVEAAAVDEAALEGEWMEEFPPAAEAVAEPAFAELFGEEELVSELEIDFDALDMDMEEVDDLDSFWETAAEETQVLPDDAITIDDAIQLGLIPDDIE